MRRRRCSSKRPLDPRRCCANRRRCRGGNRRNAARIEPQRTVRAALGGATIRARGGRRLAYRSSDAQRGVERTRERRALVLYNKADLGRTAFDARDASKPRRCWVRVRDPATIARVAVGDRAARLDAGDLGSQRGRTSRSARQAAAVARARSAPRGARATLDAGEPLDVLAPELLAAIAALGEITGAVATEAMLDGIFARFCVGK